MKKIILVLIGFIGLHLNAQEANGIAGKYGNFIFIGREFPKNKEVKILRNETAIATLSFPATAEEFISKVQMFYTKNDYYPVIEDSLLNDYWQWATGFSFMDSLPVMSKKPDILYGLGLIYFDELNDDNKDKTSSYLIEYSKEISQTLKITQPATNPTLKINLLSSSNDLNSITNEYSILGDFNLLNVINYKQHVGQDEMQRKNCDIYIFKFNDSTVIRTIDTNVFAGLTYKYTLSVVDIFGFENSQADTAKIINIPINSLPIILKSSTKGDDVNKSIIISWQLQNKEMVQTIDIFRSIYFDSAYSYLSTVNANDTTYTDFAVKPVTAYWYKVVINGVFERGLNTSKVTGILKKGAVPMSVNQITANAVNTGIKITWSNSTDEARGFYVYRCEGYKGKMELISDLILTKNEQEIYEFLDSSLLINNGYPYSYTVKVLSNGYVYSEDSDTVSAIFSSQNNLPMISDLKSLVDGKIILITWQNLSDQFPQIAAYRIYRSKSDTINYAMQAEITSDNAEFIDTVATIGINYIYKVVAKNNLGQEGAFTTIEAEILSPTVFAPEIISAEYLNNTVILNFEKNEQEGVLTIEIYRIEQGNEAQKIAVIPASQKDYIDKAVSSGKIYFYYATVSAYGKEGVKNIPLKVITE